MIEKIFSKYKISLTKKQVSLFEDYYNLLLEWNSKINLTSITSQEDIIIKHFLDSCLACSLIKDNSLIIDIGSGAGFPGIPLKILNPTLSLTLIDSVNKKIVFLNEVINKLKLENCYAIHSRAEDIAFDNNYREKFDYCVSRAVASLNTLSEYCLPFVKVGGNFIAYKSIQLEEELKSSNHAITMLCGKVDNVYEYNIEENQRKLVCIKKLSKIPNNFPRKNNKPRTSPL